MTSAGVTSAGVTSAGGAAAGGFPTVRPRRLRRTPALRRLVTQVPLLPSSLVLPLFVHEGLSEPRDVVSMPGVKQHTVDSARRLAGEAVEAGVGGLLLFGVQDASAKDERGSGADAPDGVVQRALRALAADVGDATVLVSDLCLDEFTSHGHCGLLRADGSVDNDATLERYASVAVSQAAAGAAVVAPSGMMDGQVAAIRGALDSSGHTETAVLAYSAKYASALYGPFRDAADCAPAFGDRRGYQQDPARSVDEAVAETLLDVAEGADLVMVKPAVAYLDVVAAVAGAVRVPVWAYQVSGEHAMVEAAAARGWVERERVIDELLTGVRRAGADVVVTYWALEAARRLSC